MEEGSSSGGAHGHGDGSSGLEGLGRATRAGAEAEETVAGGSGALEGLGRATRAGAEAEETVAGGSSALEDLRRAARARAEAEGTVAGGSRALEELRRAARAGAATGGVEKGRNVGALGMAYGQTEAGTSGGGALEGLERAVRAAAGRIEKGDVGARGEAYDEMEAALEGLMDACFEKVEGVVMPRCFRSSAWTTQPMQDPVIVASGYTAERGSPEVELGLCPATNEPLLHPYAHPNHLFSDMIAAWLADHHQHSHRHHRVQRQRQRQRQRPDRPPVASDDADCALAALLDLAAQPRTRPLLALRPGVVAALLHLAGAAGAPWQRRAGAAAVLALLLGRGGGGGAAAARREALGVPGGARALLGLLEAEDGGGDRGLAARKDAGAAAAALLAEAEGRVMLRGEGAAAAAVRALCVEPPAADEAVEILERLTAGEGEWDGVVGRRIGEVMRVAGREGLLSARGLERAAAVVRRVAERERGPYTAWDYDFFSEVLRRGTPRARDLVEDTLSLIKSREEEEEEEEESMSRRRSWLQ